MTSIILGSPVRYLIYATFGDRYYRSQRFGAGDGISAYEPRLGDDPHFHRAIDISHGGPAGACGRDVLAPAAGTVLYVGRLNDGADAVVIRHAGGWASGFGHTKGLVVKGQAVAKGFHIGEMNASGVATGCHTHFALKSGFPLAGTVNDFWLDDPKYGVSGISPTRGKGTWVDPWPLIEQNVRLHPRTDVEGVNLRTSPGSGTTLGPIYATARGGRIVRKSDGADLGAAGDWRAWKGEKRDGARYDAAGKDSTVWWALALEDKTVWVAALYAVRSV